MQIQVVFKMKVHIGRIFISDQETLFEKEEENEGPPASP